MITFNEGMAQRRPSKSVNAGGVLIGGGSRVSVQSMTNTKTEDFEKTLEQINELAVLGCDIVRVSVYDKSCVPSLKRLVEKSPVPLVADIHFDHDLAIKSAEVGVHKLRINPGNIGGEKNVKKLADCAKAHGIPIRIGVNSGSVEKHLIRKYGVTPAAMVESAMSHARLLEEQGFFDIVISVKGSGVQTTVQANRLLAAACEYPLHLGITEAGTYEDSIVKSSVGIGALLMEGIGDTIRVSISGSPLPEVAAGISMLKAAGLREGGVEVVACPTCGRTCMNIEEIARQVKRRTGHLNESVKVAVMGCVVNGPGEAKQADIGIAGTPDGGGAIFVGDQVIKLQHSGDAVDELVRRIEEIAGVKSKGQ